MKKLLEQYAADYAAAQEGVNGKQDDPSSIHYPAVYVFIGDRIEEAIEPLIRNHDQKWDNSAGVMYFHLTSDVGVAAGNKAAFSPAYGMDTANPIIEPLSDRLTRYELPSLNQQDERSKALRPDVYQSFYEGTSSILGLNQALRKVSQQIANYGRLYSSFDRIHVSVITDAQDPFTILVPEITLLAGAIFGQSFKSVQTDLYVYVNEREDLPNYDYNRALGVAFLRELEDMQRADYSFAKPLLQTEEGISIPVKHQDAPLFDLVYVLSDKNERGITLPGGIRDNDEIICQISLLKNRQKKDQVHTPQWGEAYNNNAFKNNIRTETGRQGYVSAGFAKVKRPSESIALTVLYHFYRQLILRLNGSIDWGRNEKLQFFGLDAAGLAEQVATILPPVSKLEDMHGMMTHASSFQAVKNLTLREAEMALFGEGGELYFRDNYVLGTERHLAALRVDEQMESTVDRSMQQYPRVGFFHLAEWTDDTAEPGSLREVFRALIREHSAQLDTAKADLSLLYQERVQDQNFKRVPMMDKLNLRSFIHYLIDKVYALKLYILRMESELTLARRYEQALDRLHVKYREHTRQLEQVEDDLRSSALQSIRLADKYIGQNVFEYYERITAEIMLDLEARRGPDLFFEERYIGSPVHMLDPGVKALTERMIEVVRRDILPAAPFSQTFEEELLRRSNVTIEYANKQVLSKDEMFKQLYRTLEEHSSIHLRLFDYTQEHRYEEKYFFGDAKSEFMTYALDADQSSRIYKLGMVHENRRSGVEKLSLMGGFHLEDLLFYRNGRVMYETYMANDYVFHVVDSDQLPMLR
ncbi:hypothetical protein J2Z69_001828 [Paenibacillus shirakamiensis]|uniref:Transcription initiation factor TFIID n=1 Tax=Paenibacillus shirakamiensis TaxID=1265935 RepID=A0ABS4JGF8_9BACL|nr:transcription initiation factor TFIID [Paenibacillus shirakamiensis]MBP2000797.1 hypothetical protein [Paenibacillus shirakamiensis]